MNCPYCNKQIPDNTRFCPHCGQTVEIGNSSSSVNSYWGKVNQEDRQRSAQYGAVMNEKAQIQNSRRMKSIVIAIVVVALFAGGIFGFINIQSDSTKKLEQVKTELPGNSYTCQYSQTEAGFWIHYYYYKLDFNKDGTLDYYYLTTVGPRENDDKFEHKGTLIYDISRSIFGKYESKVNGDSFILNVDDENHPKSIKYDS